MTNDDVHLFLAFLTFLFILISPIGSMIIAIIWLYYALLVDDYSSEE